MDVGWLPDEIGTMTTTLWSFKGKEVAVTVTPAASTSSATSSLSKGYDDVVELSDGLVERWSCSLCSLSSDNAMTTTMRYQTASPKGYLSEWNERVRRDFIRQKGLEFEADQGHWFADNSDHNLVDSQIPKLLCTQPDNDSLIHDQYLDEACLAGSDYIDDGYLADFDDEEECNEGQGLPKVSDHSSGQSGSLRSRSSSDLQVEIKSKASPYYPHRGFL